MFESLFNLNLNMTFSERDLHNIRTGKGTVVGLVYSGYCQSLLLHCASPYRLSRCEAEKTRTVTGLRLSPSCHGSGRLGLPLPASDTDWSGPWHGRLKRYSDCYYRGICLGLSRSETQAPSRVGPGQNSHVQCVPCSHATRITRSS